MADPNLNDIYLALGKLQGAVEAVATGQIDHKIEDNKRHDETQADLKELTKHVNHENDLMSDRIDTLEKDKEHRNARTKLIVSTGALLATVVTILVLALAVPWHDIHI